MRHLCLPEVTISGKESYCPEKNDCGGKQKLSPKIRPGEQNVAKTGDGNQRRKWVEP